LAFSHKNLDFSYVTMQIFVMTAKRTSHFEYISRVRDQKRSGTDTAKVTEQRPSIAWQTALLLTRSTDLSFLSVYHQTLIHRLLYTSTALSHIGF
jgi:hypothetical protein